MEEKYASRKELFKKLIRFKRRFVDRVRRSLSIALITKRGASDAYHHCFQWPSGHQMPDIYLLFSSSKLMRRRQHCTISCAKFEKLAAWTNASHYFGNESDYK